MSGCKMNNFQFVMRGAQLVSEKRLVHTERTRGESSASINLKKLNNLFYADPKNLGKCKLVSLTKTQTCFSYETDTLVEGKIRS